MSDLGLLLRFVDPCGAGKQGLPVGISDGVGDGDGWKVAGWSAADFDVIAGF